MIGPIFESISKTKPEIAFIKIDVDKLPQTAQDHQIQSVPTFIFVSGNKSVAKVSFIGELAVSVC
jgi:thioredoxin-like negative regulator of GroEL